MRPPKAVRQFRFIRCPELKNGIGTWGFKWEEDNSKVEEQMFGNQMFAKLCR